MKTLAFDLHGTLAFVRDGAPAVRIADPEYLGQLYEKYAFVLVTGCSRTEATETLRSTGLDRYFSDDIIITTEDCGGEKDTGKPFIELRRRTSGPVVMIGDHSSDVTGSALAGIPAILIPRATSLQDQERAFRSALGQAVELLESM